MRVFLIGLPGAGKTTLGKALAALLGRPFIDLDQVIESGEHISIPEIFQQKGEAHFRELEHAYLIAQINAHPDFVMATGGGAPCFHANLNRMDAAGITIFLDVPAAEIVRRMEQSSATERPLLANVGRAELKDRIEFLRSQRLPFYRQARFTVTGIALQAADLIRTASLSSPSSE